MAGQSPQMKRVRLDVDQATLDLIEEVARLSLTTPKVILHAHFMEIRGALMRSNATVRLPEMWLKAWSGLQTRATEDELQRASTEIDQSALHTSRKTNSGYVGVYAHSNPMRGFIAQGRHPVTKKPGMHLGLFATADQAAWARYQHYKANGMAYGLLEEKIEEILSRPNPLPGLDETWARRFAIWELAGTGKQIDGLSQEDRRWETNNPLFDLVP